MVFVVTLQSLKLRLNTTRDHVAHMNFRLALRSPHCVRRTHRGPHKKKRLTIKKLKL